MSPTPAPRAPIGSLCTLTEVDGSSSSSSESSSKREKKKTKKKSNAKKRIFECRQCGKSFSKSLFNFLHIYSYISHPTMHEIAGSQNKKGQHTKKVHQNFVTITYKDSSVSVVLEKQSNGNFVCDCGVYSTARKIEIYYIFFYHSFQNFFNYVEPRTFQKHAQTCSGKPIAGALHPPSSAAPTPGVYEGTSPTPSVQEVFRVQDHEDIIISCNVSVPIVFNKRHSVVICACCSSVLPLPLPLPESAADLLHCVVEHFSMNTRHKQLMRTKNVSLLKKEVLYFFHFSCPPKYTGL